MADNVRVNYGKLLRRILLYFVVVFICLFILYPYFVMVCTALKSRAEIFAMEGTIFPKVAMWSNFVDIWQKAPMAKYMLNSVIIAGGSTAIAMVCGIPEQFPVYWKDRNTLAAWLTSKATGSRTKTKRKSTILQRNG